MCELMLRSMTVTSISVGIEERLEYFYDNTKREPRMSETRKRIFLVKRMRETEKDIKIDYNFIIED